MDGGIQEADRIFGDALFDDPNLLYIWKNLPPHPLQEEEANGDRHWVESSPALQVGMSLISLFFDSINCYTLSNTSIRFASLRYPVSRPYA